MLMFYAGLVLPKWNDFFGRLAAIPMNEIVVFLLYVGINALLMKGSFGLLRGAPVTMLSFILLGMLTNSPSEKFSWLENRILNYLGKISYSFYLFQFITMYILAYWLFPMLPVEFVSRQFLALGLVLIVANVAVSLLIAHWNYRLVEEPSLKLGKLFSLKAAAQSKLPMAAATEESAILLRQTI